MVFDPIIEGSPSILRMTRTTATTHFYYNEHKEERQLYSPSPPVLCQCCKYGGLTGFSETCYIKIKRFLSKLAADSMLNAETSLNTF